MDAQAQTLDLIVKYGLTVRQIPEKTIALYSYQEGTPLKDNQRLVQKFNRTMIEEVSYPELGGKWMAKAFNRTCSQVDWSTKEDHLSDTIHEAVSKAVAAIEATAE